MLTRGTKNAIGIFSLVALLMNVLNGFFLITASHYTVEYSYGILINKLLTYQIHPVMEAVDIVFGLLLIVIVLMVLFSSYRMIKIDERGYALMIYTDCAIVLWSVLYPWITHAITGILTPMLVFCIIQVLVFIAISVALTIYLLKENYFI